MPDAMAGGGIDWGSLVSPGDLKTMLNLGTSIYGLSEGNNLKNMANAAFGQQNPFASYRPQFAQQLAGLVANPSSITSTPGYQFQLQQGEQAVTRGMGAKGLNGSGNEAIALEQYGQNYAAGQLSQQEQLLAQLSGANITPNAGSALAGYAAGSGINQSAFGGLGAGLTYGNGLAGMVAGLGGSAGTPVVGGGGGFSAAGGEAAQAIGTANAGLKLYNSANQTLGNAPNSVTTQAGKYLGDAALGLGIYSGIERGGVMGYGQAAADVAKLGSNLGAFGAESGAVGAAAGYVAAPLALYNFVDQWKSGATGHDALNGAEAGAAIGSVVPVVGTAIGALIGGAVGAISSAFGGKDVAKENWQGFVAGGDRQDPTKVSPTGLMWTLGGLWKSKDGNFPGIKNFSDGNKFSTAMADQISSAITQGKISKTTDPSTVYQQVVQPWLTGLPGGSNWSKSGVAGAEQQLVLDLTTNYMTGKPITWGETQGGKPEYAYTPLKQIGMTGATAAQTKAPTTPATPALPSAFPNLMNGQGANLARMAGGIR